jgi:hypothetical protein
MAGNSYIGIKLDGLKALEAGLKTLPAAIPNVTSLSINYCLRKMNTEAWRAIQPRYFVDRRTITRSLKMIYANPTKLAGALVATGKHLYMGRFKFSPTKPTGHDRVSVQLGPGISQSVPASAFVAVMNAQGQNYKGIFMRRGSRRFPIVQLRADVGAAEMLANKTVRSAIGEKGMEEFNKEFKRLTKVQLDKAFGSMPK